MPNEIATLVREYSLLENLAEITKAHVKKPPLKLGISVLTEIAHVFASYAGVEEYFDIMLQSFGKNLPGTCSH